MVSSAINFIDIIPKDQNREYSNSYLCELIEGKYDTTKNKVYICFQDDEAIGITSDMIQRTSKSLSTVASSCPSIESTTSITKGDTRRNDEVNNDFSEKKIFWNSRI